MIARGLVAASAVVYLLFVIPQLNRPLMYDDANFALAARAVADTGLPFGNQGWMGDRGDISHQQQWGLWHPPLYVYALGLLTRIAGWTPAVLRLLGLLGGLATGGHTYLLAREITRGPPAMKEVAGAMAATLVLLCPLVVQSSLVVDVDFALLLPLILFFVWLYIRLEHTPRLWLWLAPAFAVLLWAKMTNPLALIAVIFVWQLLRGHYRRALIHLLAIGIGGVAIFGASWLVIGTALGFPLDMPFSVNLAELQDSADVAHRAYTSPGAFIEGLQPTVLWIGPGLFGLGLLGSALRSASLARCWRFRGVDLLIGVALVLVLGYVNKSAGWFPKYQVAIVPLLGCIAAPVLAAAWCARPRLVTATGLAVAAAIAVVTLVGVRDRWALERTWAIDPSAGVWFLTLVILATLMGLRWRLAGLTACTAVAGVALGWSVAVDAVQVGANYQTDYWYGSTGTLEAAAWVNTNLAPEDTYVSSKEVAIASQDQRYVDQDDVVYLIDIGKQFEGTWFGEPVHAVVSLERDAYIANMFGRAMPAAGFHETARFGDYVVYVPSS